MERASGRIVVALVVLAACAAAGVLVLLMTQPRANPRMAGLAVGAGLVVAVILLAALAVVFRAQRSKPNPSRGERVGEQHGLTYQAGAPRGFHHDFGPLPGIPRGGDVRHVFRGTHGGRDLVIFHHQYFVSTGTTTVPIIHSVYLTTAPAWPIVSVARRGTIGRLLFRLGRRRGLLLEDPTFNAAFKVKTDDEDFALTLLHPEMQRFMLEKPTICWHVHVNCMAMIYRGSLRMDRIDASLARLGRFWQLVPTELESW